VVEILLKNIPFMINQQPLVWEHLPMHLNRQEIVNPYAGINEFFQSEVDMSDVRKHCKTVFHSAISKECSLSKSEMTRISSFKPLIFKLVELCYLVWKDHWEDRPDVTADVKDKNEMMKESLYYDTSKSKSAWDCFPRYLSRKEFLDPYKVFNKVFECKAIAEWRTALEDLYSSAMFNESIYECYEENDPWTLCELLLKLVEAAHLLFVRIERRHGYD
jgi:hypothetical protein